MMEYHHQFGPTGLKRSKAIKHMFQAIIENMLTQTAKYNFINCYQVGNV